MVVRSRPPVFLPRGIRGASRRWFCLYEALVFLPLGIRAIVTQLKYALTSVTKISITITTTNTIATFHRLLVVKFIFHAMTGLRDPRHTLLMSHKKDQSLLGIHHPACLFPPVLKNRRPRRLCLSHDLRVHSQAPPRRATPRTPRGRNSDTC